jgi:hypothetical protein
MQANSLSAGLNDCLWHETIMPVQSTVRCLGRSGRHLIRMSISHFDPKRKSYASFRIQYSVRYKLL